MPSSSLSSSSSESSNSETLEARSSLLSILCKTLNSISQSAQESKLNPWGLPEFLGLLAVFRLHKLKRQQGVLLGCIEEAVPVTNRWELEEILFWLRWAEAAYVMDAVSLAKRLGINEAAILKFEPQKVMGLSKPAYYVAIDDDRKMVILGVRGTSSSSDILTDLNSNSQPFNAFGIKGHAHAGMLNAALWLLKHEHRYLRHILKEHEGYSLTITGHSLGAGTAALLAFLLRDPASRNLTPGGQGQLASSDYSVESYVDERGPSEAAFPTSASIQSDLADEQPSAVGIAPENIGCWAFACPPILDINLCRMAEFVNTVLLHDDMVPRLSSGAVEDLRNELVSIPWQNVVREGGKWQRILKFSTAGFYSGRDLRIGSEATLGSIVVETRRELRAALAPLAEVVDEAQHGRRGKVAGFLAKSVVNTASFLGYRPSIEKFRDPWGERRGIKLSGDDISAAIAENQSSPEWRAEVQSRRLYAPGVLYHIRRSPVTPGTKAPHVPGDLAPPPGRQSNVKFWEDMAQKVTAEGAGNMSSLTVAIDVNTPAATAGVVAVGADVALRAVDSQTEAEKGSLGQQVDEDTNPSSKLLQSKRELVESWLFANNEPSAAEVVAPVEEIAPVWDNEVAPSPDSKNADVSSRGTVAKSESASGKEKSRKAKSSSDEAQWRHVVMKGPHVGPRLNQLVLSSTIVTDHFAVPVSKGVIDAMLWLPDVSGGEHPRKSA